MKIFTLSVLLLTTFITTCPTFGAGMPKANVEYSADSLLETQGMSIPSKVFHAVNKDRIETDLQGSKNVMIIRMDKKLTWLLLPEQKMFMEMSLEEGKRKSNDINDCKVEQKEVGSEVVNGVKATKNKITMVCPDDLTYNGYMWVTKDNIMVKMDAVAKSADGDVSFKMDLKNLKVGKQTAVLFEIPADYQVMSVGGIMGNIGIMMGEAAKEDAKRARREAETNPQSVVPVPVPTPVPAPVPDTGAVDPVKKLRGFLGW